MAPVADTVPYPWPYDDEAGLRLATIALVVIGAQRRWARLDNDFVLERLMALARALREIGCLVVFTRHARPAHARRDTELPLLGTADWELAVEPAAGDLVVDVPAHDAFLTGLLDLELRARARDHLLFGGLGSEVLLDSTLRSANDRGYECLTLSDAVAPFDPLLSERALASITMSGGIFGAVGTSRAVLAALGVTAQIGAS